jgi:hypothetical protein
MSVDPALQQAIDSFRQHPLARRCQTPEGARNQCLLVNVEFVVHCRAQDLWAVPVLFAGPGRHALRTRYAMVCAFAAGWFIEWSNLQYDPQATPPRMFAEATPELPGAPWPLELYCRDSEKPTLRAAGFNPRRFAPTGAVV